MAELIAALRNASFGSLQYHAIVDRADGSRGPACGLPSHDDSTEEYASGLLNTEKCGRSGCRQAFERAQGVQP